MGMEEELMQRFLNKHVRLVLKPHFVIDGHVTEVHESGFFFSTPQKTSYISYDALLEVQPMEEKL